MSEDAFETVSDAARTCELREETYDHSCPAVQAMAALSEKIVARESPLSKLVRRLLEQIPEGHEHIVMTVRFNDFGDMTRSAVDISGTVHDLRKLFKE